MLRLSGKDQLSGKELTCQCRRHRFDARSRMIPHAVEQLSLCTTANESTCTNCWNPHTVEPMLYNKPPQWEACTPQLESSTHSPHLEKSPHSNKDLSSVQFSRSLVSDSATPWSAALQASLSITNSQSALRLTSIESVMPSSHLILCRPLLLLPPIPPSISLFQWVNSSHEVAKVLEFQV